MPTVETNGIETYYEQTGSGPDVVLIHASIVDHGLWKAQIEPLAKRYRVTAYDLRGHGRTGGSSQPEYTMQLFADDLEELIVALDLDPPVLVGHSMGGLVAQAFAAEHPEDISGLVLADTFGSPILTTGERFLRRILLPGLIAPARLFGYERVERANVWLTERLFGGSSGDYEKIQRLRQSGPGMTTDEFAKVVRAIARAHEHPIDLSRIGVPTLVLCGEKDLPFIKRHAERLEGELSEVQLEEIPDAGHASLLDEPEAFNQALLEFLDSIHRENGDGL